MVLQTGLRIEPLAHRLDLVRLVAWWHWDEWGHADPEGSIDSWADRLRERANPERIPITWLAFVQGVPVGSVALVDNDMTARPDLWPWLSGLFVVPSYRQRGIGTSLVLHCENAARDLEVGTLYLYASAGLEFYIRLGYQVIERTYWEGEDVAILSKRLGPPESNGRIDRGAELLSTPPLQHVDGERMELELRIPRPPVGGNPVPGIIAGPGLPAAAGQFRVTKSFAQHAPAGHGVDVANGRCGDPIFAMHAGMVSAVFTDTNGAKVSRALDSLRAALSEPQVDR